MKIGFKFTLWIFLFFVSCKKNPATDGNGNVIVKGSIKLEVFVMHHAWSVPGINVHLKRGATEWPGSDTTLYSFSVKADGGGVALFQNLFPGNYYVFAKGYDSNSATQVIGYAPLVLNSSNISNNEADITLMVSE